MFMYDYLIVGAGLYGAVFAQVAAERGKKCLVIDKRPHIAGIAYTEENEGIHVHKYGAHIFHTSEQRVWDYINRFAQFNNFVNSPIARFRDEVYNLPFNMNTFSRMWNVFTPSEAKKIINMQGGGSLQKYENLEDHAISMVGKDIYEKLIKGYTEKQWGTDCKNLPASIIKRIPLRFTYNNNYFNDRYQGIPIGGYTQLVQKLLDNIEVKLSVDYYNFISENPNIAIKTIFTGRIDEFFNYCYGELGYRSLKFETEVLNIENYQGNAVVNYTELEIPYTRIIEHKHFEFDIEIDKTIITREYPFRWSREIEPFYPINNDQNNMIYNKYLELSKQRPDVIFGGRLGKYQYFDMDKVVAHALSDAGKEMSEYED